MQYDILTREPNIASWMIEGGDRDARDRSHRRALATLPRLRRPALRARLTAAIAAFNSARVATPAADCCPA